MELLTSYIRKIFKNIIFIFKSLISLERIRILLTLFSVGFVGLIICINFNKITQEEINIKSIILLAIGCLVSVLSIIINGLAWKQIIRWLGYKENNINIIYLFIRTNSLKYLPGGIWHFLERFRVLNSSLSPEQAFASVLLEPFLMMSAALFLLPVTDLKNITLLIFLLPSVLLAKRFRNSLLMQLGVIKNLQLKKIVSKFNLSRAFISQSNPSSSFPLTPFVIEVLFILLKFAAFWFCLKAFMIDDYIPTSRWLFTFSLAWTIGLLVPSAPGGIGIFESFVLLTIGENIPEELLLLALISYRLITSIADLIVPGILFLKRIFYRLN